MLLSNSVRQPCCEARRPIAGSRRPSHTLFRLIAAMIEPLNREGSKRARPERHGRPGGDRALRRASRRMVGPEGSFRPLHRLNPARLGFIRSSWWRISAATPPRLRPFEGLTLARYRLRRRPDRRADGAARLRRDRHRRGDGGDRRRPGACRSERACRSITAPPPPKSWPTAGERFDVVLALEMVEHVADPAVLLASARRLVKPGGAFIGATLNRTARSFALAIVGAEYVLGWLPRGTHDWRKFCVRRNSSSACGARGCARPDSPASGSMRLAATGRCRDDLEVNYLVMAVRQ